jgi:hypothetical protein
MVKKPRMKIVWLFFALSTIAISTLAQDIEESDEELLASFGGIDIGHYPAHVEAQITLPGTMQSATAFRRLAARTVAVVSFSGCTISGRIQRYSDELQCAPANNSMTVAGALILTQNNPPSKRPTQCGNETMLKETPPTRPARATTWTW